MDEVFWAALALMLVIEGITPFLSPNTARQVFRYLSEMPAAQLRLFGFASMVTGVLMLYLVRS
jgi:uncharacterized protein YjeT (DUF2065 family)